LHAELSICHSPTWLPGKFKRIDGGDRSMFDLVKDLWGFMRERKKFWLAPIIATLLLMGVLIALAQYSAVAPFIYTLF
jgi:hypothetical protein